MQQAGVVRRMYCRHIPDVPIISIGERPVVYLIHATKMCCELLKVSRRTGSDAMRVVFVRRGLTSGGDIVQAFNAGPLRHKVYTHKLQANGGGSPSYYVTLDGACEILDYLPNQNEASTRKYRAFFVDFLLDSSSAITVATQDPCVDDDEVEDGFSGVAVASHGSGEPSWAVTPAMWLTARISNFEYLADKRVLEAEVRARDVEIKAKDSVIQAKDAALKSKCSEADALLAAAEKEIERVKAVAAKDKEIMELRLQLSRAENRRVRGGDGEKEHDEPKLRKVHHRDTLFYRFVSAAWSNSAPGVNNFAEWPGFDENGDNMMADAQSGVELTAGLASGICAAPGFKHRSFGFCYRGPGISRRSLLVSGMVKEAFAAEADGVHYVCLVLYKRAGGSLHNLGGILYASGILPSPFKPETIAGTDRFLSVYHTGMISTDPVLEMLKRPSSSKCAWLSAAEGD